MTAVQASVLVPGPGYGEAARNGSAGYDVEVVRRQFPILREAPYAKASVVSFLVDGVHLDDIGTIRGHQGIAGRAGHHCAQPSMSRLGVAATARASLGCYNTRQDSGALVAGGSVQETFR